MQISTTKNANSGNKMQILAAFSRFWWLFQLLTTFFFFFSNFDDFFLFRQLTELTDAHPSPETDLTDFSSNQFRIPSPFTQHLRVKSGLDPKPTRPNLWTGLLMSGPSLFVCFFFFLASTYGGSMCKCWNTIANWNSSILWN